MGAAVVGHLRQEEAGRTVSRKEIYDAYWEDSLHHFSQQTHEMNSPHLTFDRITWTVKQTYLLRWTMRVIVWSMAVHVAFAVSSICVMLSIYSASTDRNRKGDGNNWHTTVSLWNRIKPYWEIHVVAAATLTCTVLSSTLKVKGHRGTEMHRPQVVEDSAKSERSRCERTAVGRGPRGFRMDQHGRR